MKIATIAESIQVGLSYRGGSLCIQLNERVRRRYRRYGSAQDGYELVIAKQDRLKVKRVGREGKLMSLPEWLRHVPFSRFAVVSNQAHITSLLPSMIPLADDRLDDVAIWHLLAYDVEWRVESTERFYLHFLRGRAEISEFDVLARIAGDIRAEYRHYLDKAMGQSGATSSTEPLPQALLDEFVIPQVNLRIAETGIKVRRFYRSATHDSPEGEGDGSDARAVADAIHNLRRDAYLPPRASEMRWAIISGLLCHLCQELGPDKHRLEQVLRFAGFDISFDELRNALLPVEQPDSGGPAAASISPNLVIQRLKTMGRAQIRAANRIAPQDMYRRDGMRRKALAFLELALLLCESPILAANQAVAIGYTRVELLALIQSLNDQSRKRKARMAFLPGSAVHLMAVIAECVQVPGKRAAGDATTIAFAQEILPLVVAAPHAARESVAVWTPKAAASRANFVGAAENIDLTLQVLEPGVANSEVHGAVDSALFWSWKVRASGERFSVRLLPTGVATEYDIELQDAEFVDDQPSRSSTFPGLPHVRLNHEPLELGLLIDGYWLADGSAEGQGRLNRLQLLADLLDGLDEIENLSKRGLLIHAAICLDEHISQEFLAAYHAPPCLDTLGDAPIETTVQLMAEWLQPWVERWNAWQIKPYPRDTDISLEKGLWYFRRLKWQQTTHPEQRALLVIGRSRPHDHARYYTPVAEQRSMDTGRGFAGLAVPYHPDDRFSVTDIDWREELRGLRTRVGTILALCDPGLPNPRYHLSPSHALLREYQDFWATVDPGTRIDVDDELMAQSAAIGIDRVVQTLDTQLFQRRALPYCQPPLAMPLAQILPHHTEPFVHS